MVFRSRVLPSSPTTRAWPSFESTHDPARTSPIGAERLSAREHRLVACASTPYGLDLQGDPGGLAFGGPRDRALGIRSPSSPVR